MTAGDILAANSSVPNGSTAELHLLNISGAPQLFASSCLESNIIRILESNIDNTLMSNLECSINV